MRNWSVPDQWATSQSDGSDIPDTPADHSIPVRQMRRKPLRKSGGFIKDENIFADLDVPPVRFLN